MRKVRKIERKILSWIENHIDVLMIVVLILLSLIARYFLLSYESEDYNSFLKPWFYELKESSGLAGLAHYPGDYNASYMTIMALLTYLKINPLISIKLVSILFDYILAFFMGKFVYDVAKERKNSKFLAIVTFEVTLFLPTLLLNGTLWGQCDVIYTTFLIVAFYLLYKGKTTLSFISLGCAFAFKLQFIFVLPVYFILYFRKKNFSIFHFVLIPFVNFILCLPAILIGKPIMDCILVYFKQTSSYKSLNLNLPNFYSLITGEWQYLAKFGMIICITVFVFLLYFIIKRKVNFNLEKIINCLFYNYV